MPHCIHSDKLCESDALIDWSILFQPCTVLNGSVFTWHSPLQSLVFPTRANASLSVVAFCTPFASATLTFHRDRFSFKSPKRSHSPADLLNPPLGTRHSRATLNVTLLVLKHCLFAVPDMQPDNTTKELVRDLRRWLYVSILIPFQTSKLYKSVLARKPKQGQRGLATSNPIRPRTMLTKTTDTSCQQTLSRELYLVIGLPGGGWRVLGSHFKLHIFVAPFISL